MESEYSLNPFQSGGELSREAENIMQQCRFTQGKFHLSPPIGNGITETILSPSVKVCELASSEVFDEEAEAPMENGTDCDDGTMNLVIVDDSCDIVNDVNEVEDANIDVEVKNVSDILLSSQLIHKTDDQEEPKVLNGHHEPSARSDIPIIQEESNILDGQQEPPAQSDNPIIQEESNILDGQQEPPAQSDNPIIQEEPNILDGQQEPPAQSDNPIIQEESNTLDGHHEPSAQSDNSESFPNDSAIDLVLDSAAPLEASTKCVPADYTEMCVQNHDLEYANALSSNADVEITADTPEKQFSQTQANPSTAKPPKKRRKCSIL